MQHFSLIRLRLSSCSSTARRRCRRIQAARSALRAVRNQKKRRHKAGVGIQFLKNQEVFQRKSRLARRRRTKRPSHRRANRSSTVHQIGAAFRLVQCGAAQLGCCFLPASFAAACPGCSCPACFPCLSHSQLSAPPVWYSITRVSKKLRSFFRSIISLIQGKGFSSCGNKGSRPICCARRFAMNRR